MKNNDEINKSENNPFKKPTDLFYSSENLVTVYTILCVLLKMRSSLGFEAMVGYIERYLNIIGGYNPNMKRAVASALKFINVKKIYEDLMER